MESLYEIIKFFNSNGNYQKGFEYGILGYNACLNFPSDTLFVNYKIHKYLFMNELAISSFNNKCYSLAIELYDKLIDIISQEETDLDINTIKKNRSKAIEDIKNETNVVCINVKKLNKEQYN